MCQPKKWLWGLLPLALLLWATGLIMTPAIEADLAASSRAQIAQSSPWAKLTYEGRDGLLEGVAPAPVAPDLVITRVSDLQGVREIENRTTLLAQAKPFTWGAVREPNRLILNGHVDPAMPRHQVMDAVKSALPGVEIVDQMKDARGAPATQLAITRFGLGQLAKLETGILSVSDSRVSLSGTAADRATGEAVKTALAQPPAPIAVDRVDITMPAPAVPAPPSLPVQRPYTWTAQRTAAAVTISGFAPSPTVRAHVLDAVKAAIPAVRIIDQMRLATGLPGDVDFTSSTGFAASVLGRLKTGTARISDSSLTIEGEAGDIAGYTAALSALKTSVPAGLGIDGATIIPPRVASYVWRAEAEAGAVKLRGYYPDEATRLALLGSVKERFASATIDEQLTIASGAPANLRPSAATGLEQLARLEKGVLVIAGGKITLSGIAANEQIANDVRAVLRRGVGGIAGEVNLTVPLPVPPPPVLPPFLPAPQVAKPEPPPAVPPEPVVSAQPSAPSTTAPQAAALGSAPPATAVAPVAARPALASPVAAAPPAEPPPVQPPEPPVTALPRPVEAGSSQRFPMAEQGPMACVSDLGQAFGAATIRFDSSSAALSPASRPSLARLADVLKRCGSMKVRVEGHTDATGRAVYNQSLSEARAKSVVGALVAGGAKSDQLQSAGFGPSRPRAANSTESGKARNRRIDFVVVN